MAGHYLIPPFKRDEEARTAVELVRADWYLIRMGTMEAFDPLLAD